MNSPSPSTPACAKAVNQVLETSAVLQALAGAALDVREIGQSAHLLVPAGYTHKEITDLVEKARPAPSRKHGTVALGDVPSLIAYCKDQARTDHSYLYADPDARSITAVFNDHRHTASAGWRDHRAVFKAEFTPEFNLWLSNNKKPMGQTDFAEFLEDNLADLQGDDAQLLLNVASTIQATSGINFASARRLQDGQTQLTYHEVIDAKAGADGALKIPQTFTLGLRIFKNGDAYKLTARLKYRLGGGSVKFWYELERPERAVEDAFKGYVEEVRDKSGYALLVGKA